MGTNYYLKKKGGSWFLPRTDLASSFGKQCAAAAEKGAKTAEVDVSSCVIERDRLHIGKSSAGWHFGLCIYPSLGIYGLDDWKRLFEDPRYSVEDEDGEGVSAEKMIEVIVEREGYAGASEEYEAQAVERENSIREMQGIDPVGSYDDLLAENHAERGLNGLYAHRSCLDDPRKDEAWKGFLPLVISYFRTDGTYDLTPDWDFS